MRSVAQYQQNSSYCHIGNFEIPPRITHNVNNGSIAIILAPCTSEQHPTSSNTPSDLTTAQPPSTATRTNLYIVGQ